VLGELAVFENARHRRRSMPRDDRGLNAGEDGVIFVAECVAKAANKIEQTITARRNMRAVLDVAFRPDTLRSTLVERRVERLEHECLVVFG
jgi:hypothetical protein